MSFKFDEEKYYISMVRPHRYKMSLLNIMKKKYLERIDFSTTHVSKSIVE